MVSFLLMNKEKDSPKKSTLKRTIIEWGIIGSVIALLYVTGLHTEVLGTMQRALLWTGFFDADTSAVTTTDGPVLTSRDYRFSMIGPQGKKLQFGDYKGDVVFINIWASWCPPCVAEMPTIETLYNNVQDHENIRFVLLSLDEQPEKAVHFMKSKGFDMPYYFPASALPDDFRSQYLPTTYVVSKEGQIVYKKEGIADYSAPVFRHWITDLAND